MMMNTIIPLFDFVEVGNVEKLIFPETMMSLSPSSHRNQRIPKSADGCRRRKWEEDDSRSSRPWEVDHNTTRRNTSSVSVGTAAAENDDDKDDDSLLSPRRSLRIKLEEVAASLAPIEVTLLEGILEQGSEAQVALAQERLAQSFPAELALNSSSAAVAGKCASSDPTTTTQNNCNHNIGSSARRASLMLRQQNNSTHNAMLRAFAKRRWKNAGNLIINLNKTMGRRRVERYLRRDSSDVLTEVEEMKRRNRRTSTPAEMKEIALLAIQQAAQEEAGWRMEDENASAESSSEESSSTSKENNSSSTLPQNNGNDDPIPRSKSKSEQQGNAQPQTQPHYDPWARVDEDFNGIHFDFSIIGTSPDDKAASPHVLSPPLMHRLQDSLPFCKRGESFWLKYSLVRDGASMSTFLNKIRGSKYSILALESLDGEVFGAFTAEPWHLDHNFYGGTSESFVWKMKHHRGEISDSIAEQARIESEIDIFRYSYENNMVQLCQSNPSRLAVGGGCCSSPKEIHPCGEVIQVQPHQWGFAISFDDDCLLEGTSSPCITFQSPSLSNTHSDGSRFEVLNLEAWALTPCLNLEEAEIMECRATFLQRNVTNRVWNAP